MGQGCETQDASGPGRGRQAGKQARPSRKITWRWLFYDVKHAASFPGPLSCRYKSTTPQSHLYKMLSVVAKKKLKNNSGLIRRRQNKKTTKNPTHFSAWGVGRPLDPQGLLLALGCEDPGAAGPQLAPSLAVCGGAARSPHPDPAASRPRAPEFPHGASSPLACSPAPPPHWRACHVPRRMRMAQPHTCVPGSSIAQVLLRSRLEGLENWCKGRARPTGNGWRAGRPAPG